MSLKTKINGTYYLGEETMTYLKELPVNTKLRLEHEPQNPVDENAIRILSDEIQGEIHLGYIPKNKNIEVLSKINAGKKLGVKYIGNSSIEISEDGEKTDSVFFKVF